jgi:hypothetical protein
VLKYGDMIRKKSPVLPSEWVSKESPCSNMV